MLIDRITASRYVSSMQLLATGDLDGLLGQFAPGATLSFVGDGPLAADHLRGPMLRAWFERFVRLLPERCFEVQRVVVAGPPWRTRLAAHVRIRATIAGHPYVNDFGHFLTIRWGRVTDDVVIEDTQPWERIRHRLVDAGVGDAAAPPLLAAAG
ncbi:MAG: nuclear transport factor 2 family protein [Desertimonas sp.]